MGRSANHPSPSLAKQGSHLHAGTCFASEPQYNVVKSGEEAIVADFDLRSYFDCFPDVCRQKFGRAYSFPSLERKFEQLRAGKRWLVAKDVLNIFDPAQTPFGLYWPRPVEKELDQALKSAHLMVGPLPADGRDLVQRGLRVFHNIGILSLVLRFVHPDRFGAFSTPIMNLLQVYRPRTVDAYLAYCDELRVWKEHFQLPSVASTETALWTYHELTVEERDAAVAVSARAGFDADVWIQRRRVAQVLRPFLQKYGPLELARILVYEDANLAGMIAGEEYERLLRFAARRLCGGLKLYVKGATEVLFDKLLDAGHISPGDRALLRRAWGARCAAVHPEAKPAAEEVENMIDIIERICRPWESTP